MSQDNKGGGEGGKEQKPSPPPSPPSPPTPPTPPTPQLGREHKIIKDEQTSKRRTRSQIMLNPVKQSDYAKLPRSAATAFLSQFAATIPRVLPLDWKENDVIGPSMIKNQKYKIEGLLGKGSSSRCYGVKEFPTPDNPSKAIKIVRSLEGDLNSFKNEISLWSSLQTPQAHPNILPLLDWIIDETHGPLTMIGAITLEAKGGTLLDFFLKNQPKKLKEVEIRIIITQILKALSYLHDKAKVVHRDIKLENIFLLDSSINSICIGDFGLSQYIIAPPKTPPLRQKERHVIKCVEFENCGGLEDGVAGVGSLIYLSPEELESEYRRSIYGGKEWIDLTKSDIWSVGIILYSLMEGHFPFEDSYSPRLQALIRKASYHPPQGGWSTNLLELLGKMLEKNPAKRSGALNLLEYDPFLLGI